MKQEWEVLKNHGCIIPRICVQEARRAGLHIATLAAVMQQESWKAEPDGTITFGHNVFGTDPTIFAGAGKVTKAKYLAYKKQRSPTGEGGMQGVGPMQLTWWEYQDEADRNGGCWYPRANVRTAANLLSSLISLHGLRDGIRRYNGSGPDAERYALDVLQRRHRIREWLIDR